MAAEADAAGAAPHTATGTVTVDAKHSAVASAGHAAAAASSPAHLGSAARGGSPESPGESDALTPRQAYARVDAADGYADDDDAANSDAPAVIAVAVGDTTFVPPPVSPLPASPGASAASSPSLDPALSAATTTARGGYAPVSGADGNGYGYRYDDNDDGDGFGVAMRPADATAPPPRGGVSAGPAAVPVPLPLLEREPSTQSVVGVAIDAPAPAAGARNTTTGLHADGDGDGDGPTTGDAGADALAAALGTVVQPISLTKWTALWVESGTGRHATGISGGDGASVLTVTYVPWVAWTSALFLLAFGCLGVVSATVPAVRPSVWLYTNGTHTASAPATGFVPQHIPDADANVTAAGLPLLLAAVVWLCFGALGLCAYRAERVVFDADANTVHKTYSRCPVRCCPEVWFLPPLAPHPPHRHQPSLSAPAVHPASPTATSAASASAVSHAVGAGGSGGGGGGGYVVPSDDSLCSRGGGCCGRVFVEHAWCVELRTLQRAEVRRHPNPRSVAAARARERDRARRAAAADGGNTTAAAHERTIVVGSRVELRFFVDSAAVGAGARPQQRRRRRRALIDDFVADDTQHPALEHRLCERINHFIDTQLPVVTAAETAAAAARYGASPSDGVRSIAASAVPGSAGAAAAAAAAAEPLAPAVDAMGFPVGPIELVVAPATPLSRAASDADADTVAVAVTPPPLRTVASASASQTMTRAAAGAASPRPANGHANPQHPLDRETSISISSNAVSRVVVNNGSAPSAAVQPAPARATARAVPPAWSAYGVVKRCPSPRNSWTCWALTTAFTLGLGAVLPITSVLIVGLHRADPDTDAADACDGDGDGDGDGTGALRSLALALLCCQLFFTVSGWVLYHRKGPVCLGAFTSLVSLGAFALSAVTLAVAERSGSGSGSSSSGDGDGALTEACDDTRSRSRVHALAFAHAVIGLCVFCCPLCFVAYRQSTESVLSPDRDGDRDAD